MKQSSYQRVDVIILKEILKFNFASVFENKTSNNALLEIVQKFNTKEICIDGIDINKHYVESKLNINEFGFKYISDFKILFNENKIDKTTTIKLIPKTNYLLEDSFTIPEPFDKKGKIYLELISDVFERIKLKAINILSSSTEASQIELYAKKNIQMAHAILDDARNTLKKAQETNDKSEVFLFYVFNIFMIKIVWFYQKMFSTYYKETIETKEKMKSDLFDVMNKSIFKNETSTNINSELEFFLRNFKIKWNGQVNVLTTLISELKDKNSKIEKPLLEVDDEELKFFMHNFIVDKNDNPLNMTTLNTCLKSYRTDKKVKDEKRIDISKYLQN